MTREEALAILRKENGVVYSEYEEAVDVIEKALADRSHGKWEYLKEHITEMRDADGELNQKQTCKFILNLMGVIEKEGDEK